MERFDTNIRCAVSTVRGAGTFRRWDVLVPGHMGTGMFGRQDVPLFKPRQHVFWQSCAVGSGAILTGSGATRFYFDLKLRKTTFFMQVDFIFALITHMFFLVVSAQFFLGRNGQANLAATVKELGQNSFWGEMTERTASNQTEKRDHDYIRSECSSVASLG